MRFLSISFLLMTACFPINIQEKEKRSLYCSFQETSSLKEACFIDLSVGLITQAYFNLCDNNEKIKEDFTLNALENGTKILIGYIGADFLSFWGHYIGDFAHKKNLKGFLWDIFIDDHHEQPHDVVYNSYANNLTPYYGAANLLLLPVTLCVEPSLSKEIFTWTILITAHSQQFHKWSHDPHVALPVKMLQNVGVLISPEAHKIHHYGDSEKNIEAFESNFSVISGWWNRPLNWIIKKVKDVVSQKKKD